MRRPLSLAISLALGAAVLGATPAFAADAAPAASAALPTTQLPRNIRPSHYQVAITPHAQTLGFDGHVEIALEVLEPTDSIVLNQIDMKFAKVLLTPAGGKALAPTRLDVDDKAQTASFVFAKPLAKGVGSSRVDLQACKLEYSIVSPK